MSRVDVKMHAANTYSLPVRRKSRNLVFSVCDLKNEFWKERYVRLLPISDVLGLQKVAAMDGIPRKRT